MKRAIINIRSYWFLIALLMNIYACQSCGSNHKGADEKKDLPSHTENSSYNTKVDYQINLDKANKIKEEGNKVYYEVPVGTEVRITGTIIGAQTMKVDWDYIPSNISGVKVDLKKGKVDLEEGSGLNWNYRYHKTTRNGKVIFENSFEKTDYTWMFASNVPISVTLQGKLTPIEPMEEGKNNLFNNEKIFVITWK